MIISRQTQKRICITGDLLRPTDDGANSSRQNGNIRRIYEMFKYPIRTCGNVSLHVKYGGADAFDVWEAYQNLELPTSIDGWVASVEKNPPPQAFLDQINLSFGGYDLIVCFEASGLMRQSFDILGFQYIDILVHPIRFLEDVMFSFYSNNDDIHHYFIDHLTPESLFYREAGFIASGCISRKLETPPNVNTILFGQTDDDKVLIQDGRLVNFSNYASEIQSLTLGESVIGYKAHPYASSNFGILEVGRPLSGFHMVTDNFYHLACSDQVEKIVSVSSSVCLEAKYFEKKAIHLGAYPWLFRSGTETSREAYTPLRHECFFEEFWRGLLHTGRREKPPVGFISPNKIRLALVNFWGFNEVSTDFIVNLARR